MKLACLPGIMRIWKVLCLIHDNSVTPKSRIMTGLLTGHSHWKKYLFKLQVADSPRCERCKQATEMASHIFCDLETQALLRFRHFSHFIETRWLCWYRHQQGTELCSKCMAPKCLCKGLHKFGKDQGVDVTAVPILMYSSLLYCTPNLIHTAEDKIMSTF